MTEFAGIHIPPTWRAWRRFRFLTCRIWWKLYRQSQETESSCFPTWFHLPRIQSVNHALEATPFPLHRLSVSHEPSHCTWWEFGTVNCRRQVVVRLPVHCDENFESLWSVIWNVYFSRKLGPYSLFMIKRDPINFSLFENVSLRRVSENLWKTSRGALKTHRLANAYTQ